MKLQCLEAHHSIYLSKNISYFKILSRFSKSRLVEMLNEECSKIFLENNIFSTLIMNLLEQYWVHSLYIILTLTFFISFISLTNYSNIFCRHNVLNVYVIISTPIQEPFFRREFEKNILIYFTDKLYLSARYSITFCNVILGLIISFYSNLFWVYSFVFVKYCKNIGIFLGAVLNALFCHSEE